MGLRNRGYAAYLLVVFLNAFVDLGHKIVIQNTVFKSFDGQAQIVLTAVVNGLILLPFILLFSPSGFLADRYAKHRVIRYSAFVALVCTLLITLSYYMGWFLLAFALTFLLAVQSAIYSPAKYGYIRELVGANELATANGWVQAITIVGILLGTLAFSVLFESLLASSGAQTPAEIVTQVAPIGWCLVALSLLEAGSALLLPARAEAAPAKRFDFRRFLRLQYLGDNLGVLREKQAIWLAIVGLSTFWAISQVMLAAFPAFAKARLGVSNTVVIQAVLACSGIGIMIGSIIAGRGSRNYIETGFIPVGALGIALGIALLPGLDSTMSMGIVFLLVGVAGGLFIVPLNALIQFLARSDVLGTVLAGNNWVQNVTMLCGLVLTAVFASSGIDSTGLFYILTLVAIIGTGYTVRRLPHSLARILVMGLLKRRYSIDVVGFDNLPRSGPLLLLGNHISWIDWALVQIACPRPVRFVMLRRIYETWYLKPFFKAFGVVPIARGQSAESIETINRLLKAGECVCLFPEGAISRNGHLGRFYTGYQRAADGVEEGVIVPFYLHGLWGSSLSRADDGLQLARSMDFKRDLIVAFGEPLPMATDAQQLKQRIVDLSYVAWECYSRSLGSIAGAWLHAAGRDREQLVVSDAGDRALDAGSFALAALAAARRLDVMPGERVAVMLPNGPDAAVVVMALLMRGAVVVPIAPGGAPHELEAGLRKLEVRQLIAAADDLAGMKSGQKRIDVERLLEPMPQPLTIWFGLLLRLLPAGWLYRLFCSDVVGDAPAAVLYDRTGLARVLTHRNVLINTKQISDMLNARADDVLVMARPLDTPPGFVVGCLLPLIERMPVVLLPEDRSVLEVARVVARHRASVLLLGAQQVQAFVDDDAIHPLMLDPLNKVVCIDDVVDAELKTTFELRFARRIYQGFGGAQSTALAALNIPDAMDLKDWQVQRGSIDGSVGMPLPGTAVRVVDSAGNDQPLETDGDLWIRGPQLVSATVEDMAPAQAAEGGWVITGLRGRLTTDGFVCLEAASP